MNIDRQTIKHYLSQLTVTELSELVNELRTDWRLPASPPSGPIVPPPQPIVAGYDVVLTDAGTSRVATVRALRATLGLDLRAARSMLDELPAVLRRDSSRASADELATAIRNAGGSADVRVVHGDA